MPLSSACGAKTVAVVAGAYTNGAGKLSIPAHAKVQQGVVAGDLPTSDPHVKGQLWNNAGAVTISAG